MDRKTNPVGTPLTLPKGVRLRQHPHGVAVVIAFTFRGRECREIVSHKATPEEVLRATTLRQLIIMEIALGTFDYARHFPNSRRAKEHGLTHQNPLVGDLLDQFLLQCKAGLEASTLKGYKKIIEGRLRPRWGRVRVQELTVADLRKWITTDLVNVKAKTARNVLSVLRTLLDDALNDELIDLNPFGRLKINRLLPASKPDASQSHIDPFSKEEISQIIAACTCSAERNLLSFGFYTGLRTSELIALKWADMETDSAIVHVRRALVERLEKKPKTFAGRRSLTLLPPALSAIQAQAALPRQADDRVFFNPRTGIGFRDDAELRKRLWIPLITRAKVRYRYPYQMRHTFASMMLEGGENILWVSRYLGHRDAEVTIRHYAKAIKGRDGGTPPPANDWSFHAAEQRDGTSSGS